MFNKAHIVILGLVQAINTREECNFTHRTVYNNVCNGYLHKFSVWTQEK